MKIWIRGQAFYHYAHDGTRMRRTHAIGWELHVAETEPYGLDDEGEKVMTTNDPPLTDEELAAIDSWQHVHQSPEHQRRLVAEVRRLRSDEWVTAPLADMRENLEGWVDAAMIDEVMASLADHVRKHRDGKA